MIQLWNIKNPCFLVIRKDVFINRAIFFEYFHSPILGETVHIVCEIALLCASKDILPIVFPASQFPLIANLLNRGLIVLFGTRD